MSSGSTQIPLLRPTILSWPSFRMQSVGVAMEGKRKWADLWIQGILPVQHEQQGGGGNSSTS